MRSKYRHGDKVRSYGISVEDYRNCLEFQGGRCAICGSAPEPGRRLSIDHDHDTSQVRGLLCTRCNVGLGYFRDQAALLQRAVDYLSDPTMPDSQRVIHDQPGCEMTVSYGFAAFTLADPCLPINRRRIAEPLERVA